MLKAHVTRATRQFPPKIHSLVRLAALAGLSLSPVQSAWARAFDLYQLEGCYPDMAQVTVDRASAVERLAQAKEFLAWLTAQL